MSLEMRNPGPQKVDQRNHWRNNPHGQSLVAEIEAMEKKIGNRLYRGLLKRVTRTWSPQQMRESSVLEQLLAQMQGAERGVARSVGGSG